MINVIGLGYIGLPTALVFAANGQKVVGTDINQKLISDLTSGIVNFSEQGMYDLFLKAKASAIEFATVPVKADYYIIAVPTPFLKVTKRVDAKYVIDAIKSVLCICPPKSIIIIESTVSPGTIDTHIRPLISGAGFELGKDLYICHAPERIIPGSLLEEMINNNKTIGTDDFDTAQKVKRLYEIYCTGEITHTDIRTAEMTKIVENTFRDISIAYANELTKICHSGGLDVYEVIRIANKHPRVKILCPGPGVGGHCIPVDPWFLVGDYPTIANLVRLARDVNDSMPEYVLERVREIATKHDIDTTRIGIYGLTYKEDTDDTRDSPSLQLLDSMHKHLALPLKAYDPYINTAIVPNQYFDFSQFLHEIDMIVILAGHKQILNEMEKIRSKVIFDSRNCCSLPGVYRL